MQGLFNVLAGNYILNSDLAVDMAGLAAQIRFGDYDPQRHAPGYIGFVP
jgi:hypothetical protein